MAGNHDGRVCLCDRVDGICAGLAVRRLSPARVQDLAEEIWTASSGDLLPARPAADARSSRAGASAQAAFRRRRAQEREARRLGWLGLIYVMLGVALAGGLLVGATVGAWLSWPMALIAAAATWSRLRFRPSAEAGVWRRQAAIQRRTAAVLRPLGEEGYLVLHDVTLPGWLGSLEHLVVGPTGVWVVASWQRPRRLLGGTAPAGILRELRSQTHTIAETLGGWASVPVRPLLCVCGRWPGSPRSFQGSQVVASRQLPDAIRRHGSQPPPGEVERAAARLLEALRPAA